MLNSLAGNQNLRRFAAEFTGSIIAGRAACKAWQTLGARCHLGAGLTRRFPTITFRCLAVLALIQLLLSNADGYTVRQPHLDVAAVNPQNDQSYGYSSPPVTDLLMAMQQSRPTYQWNEPFIVGNYRVTVKPADKHASNYDPGFFDAYIPAATIPSKAIRSRTTSAGPGVAFVGYRQATAERLRENPFMHTEGMACSVTVLAEFRPSKSGSGKTDVNITLANPTRSAPLLNADYSAPLEFLLERSGPEKMSRQGLLKPAELMDQPGLFMLEPYQYDRIPVLLVHGLDSSPRTWLDVYNELMADPLIRQRYQFWYYRYPTGNPIILSAAHLRSSLQKLQQVYDPERNDAGFNSMVVVGHSMGGLLTRILVTEPGDAFWRSHSSIPFEQAPLPAADKQLLQNTLFFNRQPFVKRVVFIATPHRGSELASGVIGEAASRLIQAPQTISKLNRPPGKLLTEDGPISRLLKIPTSIENLRPDNTFVQTLQAQPIYAIHHSIVGNNGVMWHGKPTSDGIVSYQSSYLTDAQSEVVVPADHSAHHHPSAIQEIHRILRLHLKSR